MTDRYKWVVLGGGISGLAAAKKLQAAGEQYVLVERAPAVGGLTRSVQSGDFTFDYTGHLLHLRNYNGPGLIPFADLNQSEWMRVKRNSACFLDGKLITAPVQYHLGELPDRLRLECSDSYRSRPSLTAEPSSFRDFIVSGFGERLAELFLIPQNEKTMRISLDKLSMSAVKRFFPAPDEDKILAGIGGRPLASDEYNSSFWYPKQGGIGLLVKGLSAGLSGVRLNSQAVQVTVGKRQIELSNGESLHWEHLISTIPLKSFCQMTDLPDVRRLSSQLSHSSSVNFNLGLEGNLPDELSGIHWVYFPDTTVPFYRVGFYSNISSGTCPPGKSSLYVECGLTPDELERADLSRRLQEEVISTLSDLGWIDPGKLRALVVQVLPCAYVHHTIQRELSLPDIVGTLEKHGVRLAGRYGLWDYITMEDSIISGLEVLEGLC